MRFLATSATCSEPSLAKSPYRVVRDVPNAALEIDQLAPLPLKQPWHRKLADLQRGELPVDWASLHEATCYAAIRRSSRLIGAPSRAPSYPCNPWENAPASRDSGLTYFFPLDPSMVGEKLEVVLLGMKGGGQYLRPSVWLTARDLPFTATRLKIPR